MNIIRRTLPSDYEQVLTDLHPVLRRIYVARGIRSNLELERGLEKLLPYTALSGIENAVSHLAAAIQSQKKIMIVGDFDADGATSSALAVRALRSFGAKHVSFLVPNRFAFGYGLTPELVEVAKQSQPDMIITVDNGIASFAGVEAAKNAGMTVIVTDHHLQGATLPAADAIVNPNQHADLFPSKNLAGVGVIFYVMLALRRYLVSEQWFIKQNSPEPNMAQFLDLVALGTVADLVPLDYNNRILVYQGLRRIRAGLCVPGIAALLQIAGREIKKISAADLGFAVAPRLNAAGRLDDMSLGIECLLSDDPKVALDIARNLQIMNEERRVIEKGMQQQAVSILNKIKTTEVPYGICLFDPNWHQGVIGILASRIKEKYHRPVVIFAPGNDREIKGSARSIPGLHIRDVLAHIDVLHPGLMLRFGGHAMAAGMTLVADQFSHFSEVFNTAVKERLSETDLQEHFYSDGELSPAELNLDLAEQLSEAGPWGQLFPEPLFDGVFNILDQRVVGGKHLKMMLADEQRSYDAVAFFVDLNRWPNYRCEKVRVAYHLDVNEFRDRRSVQLVVRTMDAFEARRTEPVEPAGHLEQGIVNVLREVN